MATVELREIEKAFAEVRALRGVSLSIESGEFFTLLGPSGCGKTTLLRTIAGFHAPDRGSVVVDGKPLTGVPVHARNIGLVFQSYALFPHMTVFENVAFGLESRRVPKQELEARVNQVLATVRLEELGQRTPDQLSGGQQQRVGIARALVIDPAVLLMDEPLSNLDAKLRVTMRDEIRALQRASGTTTIYVTHDQEEALAVSDRIAVFNEGAVQQVGAPREVYADPHNAFVAAFVGHMNFLPEGDAQLAVRPEDLELLADDGESAEGALVREGTVVHASFTGSLTRTRVDCGAVELLLEQHRPRELPAPGSRVRLQARADRLLRFDAAGKRITP